MNNGDTRRTFNVNGEEVRGVGSFHKSLPHDRYGEVDQKAFQQLVQAAEDPSGSRFAEVPPGADGAIAPLTNPQGGLARDRLIRDPASFSMPPAPEVLSQTAAAEMTELYWMALLRDLPFDQFEGDRLVASAAAEIGHRFSAGLQDAGDPGHLMVGVDVPGPARGQASITAANIFRLGTPGEEIGPFVSQFFVRDADFGTQRIDQMELPYVKDRNYLTDFADWLHAQNTGRDRHGQDYSHANEDSPDNFEKKRRYLSTPRDLARFVNKDALHQAYFNAALLMLSGGAGWNPGNPYANRLKPREAGFGVLGGPHILALVSEVATRALKVVWHHKWQVHLRLRPEAYGGLVHVQHVGVGGKGGSRAYGLPGWVSTTQAASRVREQYKTLLLPLAFTTGSPTHPAYGAGHATVAGACVTVLKAYFKTLEADGSPVRFNTLRERDPRTPYGPSEAIRAYVTGLASKPDGDEGTRTLLPANVADSLTLEGELNKLATNVAMGRSIGGVHWRTDNARSLLLGERMAAEILADITADANEKPYFEFRGFERKADGQPKLYRVEGGKVLVDGAQVFP